MKWNEKKISKLADDIVATYLEIDSVMVAETFITVSETVMGRLIPRKLYLAKNPDTRARIHTLAAFRLGRILA